MFRLPDYVARLRAGGVHPRPDIRVNRRVGATAVLDGDNGMGQLVMQRAGALAVEIARENGVGWVGAHHSNHAGAAAAYGKVKLAAQRGETMPEGWMVDREGKPLTDPKRASDGFLLPIGGPKGFGLALVFGLLAGTLNGAAMGRDVVDFHADSSSVTNTGQLVCALSLEAFGSVEGFRRQVDLVVRDMKASPLMPGFHEIRMPGERSQNLREERLRTGIPLPGVLRAELRVVAETLGIGAPGWL